MSGIAAVAELLQTGLVVWLTATVVRLRRRVEDLEAANAWRVYR